MLVASDGQDSNAERELLSHAGAVKISEAAFAAAWGEHAPAGLKSDGALMYNVHVIVDMWLLASAALFVGNPASSFSSIVCAVMLHQEDVPGTCWPAEIAYRMEINTDW